MSFHSGLQFRVLKGSEKDRVVQLDEKELVLGRGFQGREPGQGEVIFSESSLSRLHASLTWKKGKGRFQLTHRSSTNPTMVNGKPSRKILLEPGDYIQMGLLILRLEEVGLEKARPMTPTRLALHQRMQAIVAEVEREFSHITFERRDR